MTPEISQTVIVTGLEGLIGSEVASLAPAHLRLQPLGEPGRVDITDEGAVQTALDAHGDAGVVLHLAAFTDTNRAEGERGNRSGLCYRVNVEGTRYLARACAERELHLIYVSTDFVFPGDRDTPWAESDRPGPIDWYGETKLRGEEEVAGTPAWTIIRLAFPYGSSLHQRDLLGKILGAYARGEKLRLFDDQRITPTFIGDIALGLLRLMERPPSNDIFHLTGPDCVTPYDFGESVAEVFGLAPTRMERSRLADAVAASGRPRHRSLCMDNSRWVKLAGALGLEPPLGLIEGLRAARRRRESPGSGGAHR